MTLDDSPRILSETAIAAVTLDEERGLVVFARKNAPMDTAVLESMLAAVSAALPLERRAGLGLLFDMRRAPLGRPEHEEQIIRFAEAFQEGFTATATVFSTAIGKSQATRAQRSGRVAGGEIMSSIENACRYLEDCIDDQAGPSS